MTENTPIVMPDIVRNDRSLFTPSEPKAIFRISFIAQGDHGIEARGPQGRGETGEDAGDDRNQQLITTRSGENSTGKPGIWRGFRGDSIGHEPCR